MLLRFFLWVALLTFWLAPAARAGVQELHQAEFMVTPQGHAPSETETGAPQSLPDRWRESRRSPEGMGWYRFRFDRAALGSGVQAVYLPHASVNAVVYLNGTSIGSGGSAQEPIARTWNRPRLYLIDPWLLRPGENTLLVQLVPHPYAQASLYPLKLGPESELRALFEQAHFLRITLNQISSLLVATVGLLMLNMWWRRRRDTAYGFFAASALVWALQSTNLYIQEIPMTTTHWEILVNASFQLFSALLLMSMLRFVRADWAPLNGLLWLLLIASPLLMAVVPAPYFFPVTATLHMGTLLAALGSVVLLWRAAWYRRDKDARLLLGAMGLIVLFAAHDWLLHSQHLWTNRPIAWMPGELYLLQYSAPVVFLSIAWIMTVRFVHVLNEFEALSVELDHRVQTKHAQLEASFEQLRHMERERAALDERERIHRDLHDDVGAKLLSLVYRSESAATADLARSALQDLRDVVSRSGSGNIRFEELLADIHAECEQRLTSANLTLNWHQDESLPTIHLKQAISLHLVRIFREAVSNVIHHAHAKQVWVTLACEQQAVHIEFQDDGLGVTDPAPSTGRGLRNMESRISAIGAQMERFAATPHGFGFRIRVPIPVLSVLEQTQ